MLIPHLLCGLLLGLLAAAAAWVMAMPLWTVMAAYVVVGSFSILTSAVLTFHCAIRKSNTGLGLSSPAFRAD